MINQGETTTDAQCVKKSMHVVKGLLKELPEEVLKEQGNILLLCILIYT